MHLCRFPVDQLTLCHASLSLDMRERFADQSPEAVVRLYRVGETTAPLLLWHRAAQNSVVSLVQEYLHLLSSTVHVRALLSPYAHIPEVRVWHFCLIPRGLTVV